MTYQQVPAVQSDHDLLVIVAQGQISMRDDLREVSEGMKELKTSIVQIGTRQSDLEQRMTNVSGTVQRVVADQNDGQKDAQGLKTKLSVIEADITRWKIYMRVALILMSPVYLIILALATQAAKNYLLGP
jgi:hypothetical protein